jgi:RNA polymerase sigma factor (sigma-70 family)
VETISNSMLLVQRAHSVPGSRRGVARREVEHTMSADFAAVYASERDRLVRALSIAIGDEALANDAVDEAFTRALHRWNAVGSFDEPQAWVYRTARNWATSRFRRRSRDRRFGPQIARAETSVDTTSDPELAESLRSLPDDQRNVLVLRYYLDWSIDATANALEISPGTVKSRTNRALNELNRLLGDRS